MNYEFNHEKIYSTDEELINELKNANELSLQLIDESTGDKCGKCNAIFDIKKADKIITDFTDGIVKNFPSGTIIDYFCPECESILYGFTEVKENENEM